MRCMHRAAWHCRLAAKCRAAHAGGGSCAPPPCALCFLFVLLRVALLLYSHSFPVAAANWVCLTTPNQHTNALVSVQPPHALEPNTPCPVLLYPPTLPPLRKFVPQLHLSSTMRHLSVPYISANVTRQPSKREIRRHAGCKLCEKNGARKKDYRSLFCNKDQRKSWG